MTTQECHSRDRRMLDNIASVIRVHTHLKPYAGRVAVSIENASVILMGELPTNELKQELIPAVRQAGVLSRIEDRVTVSRQLV